MSITIRPCVSGDEAALALVGQATFLQTYAGALPAGDIIAHCRANLASFKCPRHVVFRDLPMTSTGKVQKVVLRDWAKKI